MPARSPGAEIPTRIALIGMMGAGKTTVGRRLARFLGYVFVDMDRELTRAAGKSIPRQFREDGEEAFRRRETQLLRRLSRRTGIVVSTGGGIILSAPNRSLLQEAFSAIWLRLPATEALRRIGSGRRRPIMNPVRGMPPDARLSYLNKLARSRARLYAAVGTPVRAAGKSPDALARAIARKLGASRRE